MKKYQPATLSIALSLASGLAYAQSTTEELPKLIVSGSIAAIEQARFNGSLTVIDQQQIAASQAIYLSDLMRAVPGFAVSQAGGVGKQTQIRVRGSEANHILVLIDGVRANDPALGDEFNWHYALNNNIERIEIIRGPQSTIWGSDALSGVVNIITKKATKDQAKLTVGVGSFNDKELTAEGSLGDEQFSLNGSIQRLDSGGSNVSLSGDEKDGLESTAADLAINYQPGQRFNLDLKLHQQDILNEYDAVSYVTGLPQDADLWTESKITRGSLNFGFSSERLWSGKFSIQQTHNRHDNFSLGRISTGGTDAETTEMILDNSLQFTSKSRLSLRLNQREIDFSQSGTASPYGDPNQQQTYRVLGTAVEWNQQIGSAFDWNLSFRKDDFSRFQDVENQQIAAAYRFSDATRLFANFATGSKAPTFIERFGYTPNSFVGNPNLKPEQSDSWELGLQQNWQQGKHQLTAVYFNQDLQDEIDGFFYNPAIGAFTARNKTGDSKRQGVELSFNSQLSAAFSLQFNYTYTDAEEQNAAAEQITEIRRPKNIAALIGNYRFAQQRGHLYLQANYQGKQFDYFFDPVSYQRETVELDQVVTVDTAIAWKLSEQIKLNFRVNNLFDEKHQQVYGYARPGTNAHFSVTFSLL